MKRKPDTKTSQRMIWDLACEIKDTILMTTFDWGELLNLCHRHGLRPETGIPDNVAKDTFVFNAVHRACHEKGSLSKALQRMLDKRFERSIRFVRNSHCSTLNKVCFREDLFDGCPDLPGLFWAMATDRRDCTQPLVEYLQSRIQKKAFQSLMVSHS